MLMIDPRPARFIAGSTACVVKNCCFRFTAIARSQNSGVTSSTVCRRSSPALLISASTPENRASTRSTAARRSSVSVRSHRSYTGGRCPAAAHRATSRSAASSCTSRKATRPPCSANASTIASPIPLAPPVTSTHRPRRLGYCANCDPPLIRRFSLRFSVESRNPSADIAAQSILPLVRMRAARQPEASA